MSRLDKSRPYNYDTVSIDMERDEVKR